MAFFLKYSEGLDRIYIYLEFWSFKLFLRGLLTEIMLFFYDPNLDLRSNKTSHLAKSVTGIPSCRLNFVCSSSQDSLTFTLAFLKNDSQKACILVLVLECMRQHRILVEIAVLYIFKEEHIRF